ncbi:glycosyltransferase [Alkalihalobacillus sp. FSL R5-0424]
MKVLFLSSGYRGSYTYIEQSIVRAFLSESIPLVEGRCIHEFRFQHLVKLCQTENPTFIFTVLGYKIPQAFLTWAKSQQIPVFCWLTEDPYLLDQSLELAPNITALITVEKTACSYYEKQGYYSLHLPLGADYSIFKPKRVDPAKQSDLCLIGYPYPDRVELIRYLANQLPIEVTVAGNWYPYSLPRNVTIASLWVTPEEAVDYYTSSNIVLNTYRKRTQPENKNTLGLEGISPNNRVFEVAGCKVCLLSEKREDWSTWFNEEDVPLFESKQDLVEQTESLLKNSSSRTKYALNSYQTARLTHSYANRVNQLVTWIQEKDLTS